MHIHIYTYTHIHIYTYISTFLPLEPVHLTQAAELYTHHSCYMEVWRYGGMVYRCDGCVSVCVGVCGCVWVCVGVCGYRIRWV
jgi:hypothetical protein